MSEYFFLLINIFPFFPVKLGHLRALLLMAKIVKWVKKMLSRIDSCIFTNFEKMVPLEIYI